MTRQTAKLLKENGITRELTVKLDRNFKVEALKQFNTDQRQHNEIPNRRASVAGTNVYRIGNEIRETGFDYLGRVRRPSRVQINPSSEAQIQNQRNNFSINVRAVEAAGAAVGVGASTSSTFPAQNFESFSSLAQKVNQNHPNVDHQMAFDGIHLSHRLNFEVDDASLASDERVDDLADSDSDSDFGLSFLNIEPNDGINEIDNLAWNFYFLNQMMQMTSNRMHSGKMKMISTLNGWKTNRMHLAKMKMISMLNGLTRNQMHSC